MTPDINRDHVASTTVEAPAWRGHEAWRLTDGALEVAIVPRLGGKIAKLTDLRVGREWQYGGDGSTTEPHYGDSFVDHDPSFLGLGTQPPDFSWGSMLSGAHAYMRTAWWLALFPGLAITLTVTGFNFLGDGVRDALDPRVGQ